MTSIRFAYLALVAALTLVPPALAGAADGTLVAEKTIADLTGDRRPLRLEFAHSRRALGLPISARIEPVSLRLRLKVVQSIVLVPERSQLIVRVNGIVAAQVPVIAGQPVVTTDLTLPVELLKPGYNELQFEGVQHYPTNCEVGEPPESWQEIDPLETVLTLTYRERPVTLSLGYLAETFDERLWAPRPVTIYTAGGRDSLAAATAAARGAALYYRFQPLAIGHGRFVASSGAGARFAGLPKAAGDAIIVGTVAALRGAVSAELLDSVSGAFLGIYRADAKPADAVLLISGRTTEEVERAALAFNLARGLPLPNAPTMTVTSVSAPDLHRYAGENGLLPDSRYRFESVGLPTISLAANPARLEFSLPADLYASQRAAVEITLHLAYPAGLSADSAVYVWLNDGFAGSVPLANIRGERFLDYRLSIPLRAFQPGRNALTFESVARSAVPGECAPRGTRFPVTLHGDSELSIPDAGHYVQLPDLGLFRQAVFPHAIDSAGSDLSMRLLDDGSDSLAAAFTLAGKLAQVRRATLHAMDVAVGLPDGVLDRELVVIATLDRLPAEWRHAAPAELGTLMRLDYPRGLLARAGDAPAQRWWHRLLRLDPPYRPAELEPLLTARIAGTAGDVERTAALMQFRAPHGGDRSVVLLTAAPGDLSERSAALVQFKVWNQLAGDLVLWSEPDAPVVSQLTARPWNVGDAALSVRADYWFSRYPWLLVGIASGLLILLALLVWLLLRRRLRRRQESSDPVEF